MGGVLSFYGSSTQSDDLQCGLDVDQMCSLFGQANALSTSMLSASSSPRRCFMSPARPPGMSDSEHMSSSQSQEQEYFDAGLEDVIEEDEDNEVRLVAEQLHSTELAPSDADLVHDRTPIRMHRPGSKMNSMNSMLNNEEKENSPPPQLISVSARSRTFYSRDAKSKSPFGKAGSKDEDTDMGMELGGNIAKKLF